MTFSTYVSGLTDASGIAFDASNNLYVQTGNFGIVVVNNKTQAITPFHTFTGIIYNIAFDKTTNTLWAVGTSTLYQLDLSGNILREIGSSYSGDNHASSGIAIDSTGSVFFTTTDNNILVSRKIGGVYQNVQGFINGSGVLNQPNGLAFDNLGNLYVSNSNHISKYDSSGNLINAAFITSIQASMKNFVLDNVNNFYLSEGSSSQNYAFSIYFYDSSGNLISTIYNNIGASIVGMAFDGIGNLYFTGNGGTIVTKYRINITCFKEDTKILTNKGYFPIQHLRKGDLVKTLLHGFVPINMIGKKEIYHNALEKGYKDQLYKCRQDQYPELLEDLIITGCHSILVDNFTDEEQREKVIKVNGKGKIYVTDHKYRLPACCDPRASVYENQGMYTVYHLALDNDDYYMNYGIYANGLLVETTSKRYLKEESNMTLVE